MAASLSGTITGPPRYTTMRDSTRLLNQALFKTIYIDEDNDVRVGYRNPYDGLSIPGSSELSVGALVVRGSWW